MAIPGLPENRDITYIGYSTYRDQNRLFGIKRKDRRQHMYILGKSGTGKSGLMTNMVY
jgi:type IV secretory pathway VirB4 component